MPKTIPDDHRNNLLGLTPSHKHLGVIAFPCALRPSEEGLVPNATAQEKPMLVMPKGRYMAYLDRTTDGHWTCQECLCEIMTSETVHCWCCMDILHPWCAQQHTLYAGRHNIVGEEEATYYCNGC